MNDKDRIASITLDDSTVTRMTPEIEHDRAAAIADLLEENRFRPLGDTGIGDGPYMLHLSITDNRLRFDVCGEKDSTHLILSLKPFHRLIKDYFMICESYFEAIKTASLQKIEAIDMGRRGLHNEGSELLSQHLEGKIECDFDTARRLFTLICVLHIK